MMELQILPETAVLMNGKKIFCALSGGADSLALFLLLLQLRQQESFVLEAVHFEHGFRGRDSIRDAEFCRAVCREKQIPFSLFHIDVPKNRNPGEGDEEAARRLRLEYWRKIVFNPEHSLVALGHHSGDRIENLFLRMFRGSNATGLTSMRPVQKIGRITFIRPLLHSSKQELLDYLHRQNTSEWCCDATNSDSNYKRNLIRNQLLPLIRKEFPFAEAGMLQSLHTLAQDALFLERSAEHAYAKVQSESFAEAWKDLDPALLPRVLRYFLSDETGADFIPDSKLLQRFSAALAKPDSGKHWNIPLRNIPYQLVLRKGKISCEKKITKTKAEDTAWFYEAEPVFARPPLRLTAELISIDRIHFSTDRTSAFFDAAKLNGKLIVSAWKHGDKMIPFGQTQPVSLKKLLNAAGIPPAQKEILPILKNERNEIIWIPYVKNSAFAPVSETTGKVLKLQVSK